MVSSTPLMKKEKNQLNDFFKKNLVNSAEGSNTHSFDIQQEPPLPTGIDNIIEKGRGGESSSTASRRAQIATPEPKALAVVDQFKCSLSEKTPLFLIDQLAAFQNKSIRNIQVKERLLAARRLKAMSQQMHQWVEKRLNHRVSLTKKEAEWVPHKTREEERHFLIERVIKYLTDV